MVGFRTVFAYYILTLTLCASPDFSLASGMTHDRVSRKRANDTSNLSFLLFSSVILDTVNQGSRVFVFCIYPSPLGRVQAGATAERARAREVVIPNLPCLSCGCPARIEEPDFDVGFEALRLDAISS